MKLSLYELKFSAIFCRPASGFLVHGHASKFLVQKASIFLPNFYLLLLLQEALLFEDFHVLCFGEFSAAVAKGNFVNMCYLLLVKICESSPGLC